MSWAAVKQFKKIKTHAAHAAEETSNGHAEVQQLRSGMRASTPYLRSGHWCMP